jgi:site-specific DNA-methyltransferase (adenine-specific)/modification methylase
MTEKVVIGNAELWLGDCREVLPLLPKLDALITDPPYGINVPSARRSKNVEQWDTNIAQELIDAAISKASEAVVFGGNYYSLPRSRCWLLWDKQISEGLNLAHVEMAWTNLDKCGVRMKRHLWSGPFRKGNEARNGHPTQKPLEVMKWVIEFVSGQTVLDPFMGSGTTGVACIQMGRQFIGIERERAYFDIACERISRAQAQGQMFEPEPPKAEQAALL